MNIQDTATYRITLFLSLITICIIQFDRPVALFLSSHFEVIQKPLTSFLTALEFISGFSISKYLVAFLLLLAGLIILAKDKNMERPGILFFIGCTLLLSRLTAGVLKNLFDRNRPYVFVKDNSAGDFFCEGGSSFPSAHAAHFFGLFLPLMVLFPRYTWAILILPVLVALQRVLVNDHYISDVLAGAMIAALFTLLFQRIFKIQPPSLLLPPNKTI